MEISLEGESPDNFGSWDNSKRTAQEEEGSGRCKATNSRSLPNPIYSKKPPPFVGYSFNIFQFVQFVSICIVWQCLELVHFYRSVLSLSNYRWGRAFAVHLLGRWSKDFGSVRPFEAGANVGPHKGDMWGLGLLMRGMIWFLSDLDLLFVLSFGEIEDYREDYYITIFINAIIKHCIACCFFRCFCGKLSNRTDAPRQWVGFILFHCC